MLGEELLNNREWCGLPSGHVVVQAAAHGRVTVRQNARQGLLGRVRCRVQRSMVGEGLLIECELYDLQ